MKTPDQETINWHKAHQQNRTAGARVADWVAKNVGSWPFIIAQSVLLTAWITLNLLAWAHHWDPYPFILLNLVLSFQAAYTGPIVMMSQNRQADRDRYQAEADYKVNRIAKRDIEELQIAIANLEHTHLEAIIAMLKQLGADRPASMQTPETAIDREKLLQLKQANASE